MKIKMLKTMPITAVITALMCSTALAAQYSVEYDYSNNTVKISTTTDKESDYAALQILSENKTFEDLRNKPDDSDMILYRYQNDNKGNEFSFTVEYGSLNPNRYCAKLVSGDGNDEFKINLVNAQDYSAAVLKLNELASKKVYSEFLDFVKSNADTLGYDLTLYNTLYDSESLKPYMDFVAKEQLSAEASNQNIKDFKSFVLMSAVKNSKVENIKPYLLETSLVTSDVAGEFLKLADNETEQKYVTSMMSGKKSETFAEFENALKEALILSEVRYALGYEDVQNILNKYGSVIGITGSVSSSICKSMCGKEYKTGADLLAEYKKLSENKTTITGGGGGGGGSSSSSGSSGIYAPVIKNEQPKKFFTEFNDIDGVEWASEAILALADKGIINGRSEGYFKPNDFITREEFVKILVCALQLEKEEYNNRFNDVKSNDWFVSHVNIAYNNGIVSGIDEFDFGVGKNISRQDMAVMLHNILKKYSVNIQSKELTFEDSDSIKDYAVEAVEALYGMGIINGISDKEFDPLGNATRAQAAKVVYSVLNIIQQ